MRVWITLVGVALLAALAVACLAPVAEAKERPALKQARKHAATHARCLGRTLPKRLQKTDSVKALRRYINRTWRQMRFPKRHTPAAWLPLAKHAGWPPSTWARLVHVIDGESDGDPGNITGCHMGLMQIRRDHSPRTDLLNPNSNLKIGLAMWRVKGWAPWAATAW